MSNCVFCDIVAGNVRASVVYEDEGAIAFMDLRQPTEGHVLVVPKQHVETLDALPLDLAARLMQVAVLTARAIRQSLQPAGLSLWQSNGAVAGQEVPHVHLHLLARQPDDGLLRVYPAKPPYPDWDTLDRLAATVRAGFGAFDEGGEPTRQGSASSHAGSSGSQPERGRSQEAWEGRNDVR